MDRETLTLARNVVGIVGRSGSGKTTLLEIVVAQLAARGLRVNIIKHSHHDLVLEPAHKDSARLRRAGATEVLVTSPFRFAITHELRGAQEPSLAEQIARLAPADLTLVEGFKSCPIAKLEVFRATLGQPARYPFDPFIVAVASDQAAPPDLPDAVVWLDLNAPESVLLWLLSRIN